MYKLLKLLCYTALTLSNEAEANTVTVIIAQTKSKQHRRSIAMEQNT